MSVLRCTTNWALDSGQESESFCLKDLGGTRFCQTKRNHLTFCRSRIIKRCDKDSIDQPLKPSKYLLWKIWERDKEAESYRTTYPSWQRMWDQHWRLLAAAPSCLQISVVLEKKSLRQTWNVQKESHNHQHQLPLHVATQTVFKPKWHCSYFFHRGEWPIIFMRNS